MKMIDIIDHDHVRELRLDRPPANALDPALLDAIAREVIKAPGAGADAVVLSGAPGMFTGGLDVPHLLGLDQDTFADALGSFFAAMRALAASEVPVAAAITGHSPAGGAVLALFCDWRVMAEGEYHIGFNEVRIGIPMPEVVVGLVARTMGARRAEQLCVTGQLLDPQQARAIGFVDQVVALDRVVETAVDWCRHVTAAPMLAIARTRRACRSDLVDLVERCREPDTAALADAWFRPEVQEPLQQLVRKLMGG
jgi:enoyl-CoA hydratase/carnithine racemase